MLHLDWLQILDALSLEIGSMLLGIYTLPEHRANFTFLLTLLSKLES